MHVTLTLSFLAFGLTSVGSVDVRSGLANREPIGTSRIGLHETLGRLGVGKVPFLDPKSQNLLWIDVTSRADFPELPRRAPGELSLEDLIEEARTELTKFVQNNHARILTPTEKSTLLADLAHTEIHLEKTESPLAIETGASPKSAIHLSVGALTHVFGKMTLAQSLDVLILAFANHSTKPTHFADQIRRVVRSEIRMPEFLDRRVLNFASQANSNDKLPECRNNLTMTTNPITGQISVQAYSSGSCATQEQPEFAKSNDQTERIANPTLFYDCTHTKQNSIQCSPTKEVTNDLVECTMGTANRIGSRQEPELFFQTDGTVSIHYKWCGVVGMNVFQRSADKTYELVGNAE